MKLIKILLILVILVLSTSFVFADVTINNASSYYTDHPYSAGWVNEANIFDNDYNTYANSLNPVNEATYILYENVSFNQDDNLVWNIKTFIDASSDLTFDLHLNLSEACKNYSLSNNNDVEFRYQINKNQGSFTEYIYHFCETANNVWEIMHTSNRYMNSNSNYFLYEEDLTIQSPTPSWDCEDFTEDVTLNGGTYDCGGASLYVSGSNLEILGNNSILDNVKILEVSGNNNEIYDLKLLGNNPSTNSGFYISGDNNLLNNVEVGEYQMGLYVSETADNTQINLFNSTGGEMWFESTTSTIFNNSDCTGYGSIVLTNSIENLVIDNFNGDCVDSFGDIVAIFGGQPENTLIKNSHFFGSGTFNTYTGMSYLEIRDSIIDVPLNFAVPDKYGLFVDNTFNNLVTTGSASVSFCNIETGVSSYPSSYSGSAYLGCADYNNYFSENSMDLNYLVGSLQIYLERGDTSIYYTIPAIDVSGVTIPLTDVFQLENKRVFVNETLEGGLFDSPAQIIFYNVPESIEDLDLLVGGIEAVEFTDYTSYYQVGGVAGGDVIIDVLHFSDWELSAPLCTPDWDCIAYTGCFINDTQNCNGVLDNNACGDTYVGDFSEFPSQVCDYCTPNWACNSYTECGRDTLKSCNGVVDLNVCGEAYTGDYSEYSYVNCYYTLCNENSTLGICDMLSETGSGIGEFTEQSRLPLGKFLLFMVIIGAIVGLVVTITHVIKKSLENK